MPAVITVILTEDRPSEGETGGITHVGVNFAPCLIKQYRYLSCSLYRGVHEYPSWHWPFL